MTALFARLCAAESVTLPRTRRRRWSWAQIAEFVLFVLAFAAGYAVLGPLVPLPL